MNSAWLANESREFRSVASQNGIGSVLRAAGFAALKIEFDDFAAGASEKLQQDIEVDAGLQKSHRTVGHDGIGAARVKGVNLSVIDAIERTGTDRIIRGSRVKAADLNSAVGIGPRTSGPSLGRILSPQNEPPIAPGALGQQHCVRGAVGDRCEVAAGFFLNAVRHLRMSEDSDVVRIAGCHERRLLRRYKRVRPIPFGRGRVIQTAAIGMPA